MARGHLGLDGQVELADPGAAHAIHAAVHRRDGCPARARSETDPAARRTLIDGTWAADASYIDPLGEARGRDEIDAAIAAAHAQFPGFVFSLAGPVDAHHRQARFTWGLGPEGAEPLIVGFDVAVTGAHGRLVTFLGFLDKVPG